MSVPSGHKRIWSRVPVKALLVFESVVRHRSVTKAAAEFCVTHSAVSKSIAILEAFVGASLFNRTARHMQPTAEAQTLARAVRESEDRIASVLHDITEQTSETIIDVLAPATFAMRWLIPRLPDFAIRHSRVSPQVRPTHSTDDWATFSFDVVLRRGVDMPAGLSVRPLFSERMGLVAAPRVANELRARNDTAFRRGDLVTADTRPGELDGWLDAAGFDASGAGDAEHYPHNYIALEAALAGRGAMVAPLEVVAKLIAEGRLVNVFPERTLPGKTYYVGYEKRSPNAPGAEAFIAWLEASAREPAPAIV